MTLIIAIIIVLNGLIGYILGFIFKSKMEIELRNNLEVLKEGQTVDSAVSTIRQLYLFFWIPLFLIDYYFIYQHQE